MTAREPLDVALIDWDNSLRDGWIIVDWAHDLARNRILPEQTARDLESTLRSYLAHTIPYSTMAEQMPSTLAGGLAGARVDDVVASAERFVEGDPVGLRPFASPLLEHLRAQSVCAIIVSGAPQEVLDAAVARYEFGDAFGTTLTQRDGRYVGTVDANRATGDGKRAILSDLLKRGMRVTLAVGDSDSDLPLLEQAALPVVVDNDQLAQRIVGAVMLDSGTDDISAITKAMRR